MRRKPGRLRFSDHFEAFFLALFALLCLMSPARAQFTPFSFWKPKGSGSGSGTVAALYAANGSKWNDYVKNDGSSPYWGSGTACTGGETGYPSQVCVHGGEKLKMTVTGYGSCTGLTASDDLNVFDWTCQVASGAATFFSVGLKDNKGLRDLLNSTSWKQNRLTVYSLGSPIIQSASTAWWTNVVSAAPANTLATDSPRLLSTASVIYTVDASRATSGYQLNAEKTAIVTLGDAILSYSGRGTNNCAGAAARCIIYSEGRDFTWYEVQTNAYEPTTSAQVSIYTSTDRQGVIRNVSAANSLDASVVIGYGDRMFLKDINVTSSAGEGISNYSDYSEFANVTVASTYGISFNFGTGNYVSASRLTAYGQSGFDYTGVFEMGAASSSYTDLIAHSNNGISFRNYGAYNITITNASSSGGANGFYFDGGVASASFKNIYVTGAAGNGLEFVVLNSTFENITTVANGDYGLIFQSPANLKLRNIYAANNLTSGIYFYLPSRINGTRLRSFNNGNHGIYFYGDGATDSTFVDLVGSNNTQAGIFVDRSDRATFSHFTTTNNNTNGLSFGNTAASHALVQGLVANNATGVGISTSNDYYLANLAASRNGTNVSLFNSSNHSFQRNLLTGNHSVNACSVTGGTSPGITTTTCALVAPSTGTLRNAQDASGAFVAKIFSNDSHNTVDSNGLLAYNLISDWFRFDNQFRGWGNDGGTFPISTNRNRCSGASNCRIWDWRLKTGTTVMRNTSYDGSAQNNAFSNGNPCPTAASGAYTLTDRQSPANTFLVNAIEIWDDSIGDNDGLCESNESCIYSPNFGSYQGHGNYSSNGTCTFTNGGVTGVTMYAFPTNGG